MGPSIGQELNYKPEDIQTLLRKYIDKNKDDKEKMGKLKEAVKKLKEKISDKEMTTARSTGQVVNVPSNNKQDIQTLEKNKVVYSTYPE
jgi:ethanolamine utilization protein EutQ (cupin superfamily)